MTITNDMVNGLFELMGSLFIFNHCRVLLRDKVVGGLSITSIVFFQLWGIWNIWYYPSLGQWYSFTGGVFIAIANTCWILLLMKYRKNKPPIGVTP